MPHSTYDDSYDSDREAPPTISSLQAEITRLRSLKNEYRTRWKKADTENQELNTRLTSLSLNTVKKEDRIYDSDEDKKKYLKPSTWAISAPGNNTKYPDVPNFFGNPAEWESWYLHLQSKFRASAVLFPTELDKIDYIRDHCKATAFDVIKAGFKGGCTYVSARELTDLLENTFGSFDPIADAEATIYNAGFCMANDESFDLFLARFNATVAPLQYSDSQKISTLQRTITDRLRRIVTDGIKPSSYKQFAQRLRTADAQIRQHGWISSDEDDEDDEESGVEYEAITPRSSGNYPEDFVTLLKKEKRCFRCLHTGHLPNWKNAPCKGSTQPAYEEAKALLAKQRAREKLGDTGDDIPDA